MQKIVNPYLRDLGKIVDLLQWIINIPTKVRMTGSGLQVCRIVSDRTKHM